MKKLLIISLSLSLIILCYFLLYLKIDNNILFPSIISVLRAIGDIFTNKIYLSGIFNTILNVLFSLILCMLIGLILGFLAAKLIYIRHFLSPLITILRVVPVISILVIIPIIVGLNFTPFIISSLLLIPLIYQGFLDSLLDLDKKIIYLYQLDKPKLFTGIFKVYLPAIQNKIYTLIFQSLGLALKVMVMSEYMIQSQKTMGSLLYQDKISLRYDYVFGLTLILLLISFLFESISLIFIKRDNLEKIK